VFAIPTSTSKKEDGAPLNSLVSADMKELVTLSPLENTRRQVRLKSATGSESNGSLMHALSTGPIYCHETATLIVSDARCVEWETSLVAPFSSTTADPRSNFAGCPTAAVMTHGYGVDGSFADYAVGSSTHVLEYPCNRESSFHMLIMLRRFRRASSRLPPRRSSAP
jgi:hypothetical protein